MKFRLMIGAIIAIVILSSFAHKRKPKKNKNLPSYFVEVPAGYLWDNLHTKGVNTFINDNPNKDSTERFYVSESEVSNQQYRLYLHSLKRNSQIEAYHKARPDTTVWQDKLAYNEPYTMYYFQHSAYKNYPLVGVSREQAMAYCSWLTDSLNSSNPEMEVDIRLPIRKEWIRAARGDHKQQFYAMPKPKLQNKEGLFMYNHRVVGGQNIYMDKWTRQYMVVPRTNLLQSEIEDGAMITTEVKSYWPNQFGTYNMCGNVAEMIADDTIALGGSWLDPGFDIRIESEKSATKPSSLIGFRVIAYVSLH